MGVVGQQQGVALNHLRDVPADSGLGQSPLPQVLGGDAGQLLNFRRHKPAGGQGDQLVVLLHHLGRSVHPLQRHGGKLNDLVPVVG